MSDQSAHGDIEPFRGWETKFDDVGVETAVNELLEKAAIPSAMVLILAAKGTVTSRLQVDAAKEILVRVLGKADVKGNVDPLAKLTEALRDNG